MAEPWFEANTFGSWFGILAGGVGGTLGGVLGALGGTLAPRGRGRKLVLGGMILFVALGLLSLGFGVVALALGQPWGIWCGPMLSGVIVSVVCGGLIPVFQYCYRQAEERRLQAETLRRA